MTMFEQAIKNCVGKTIVDAKVTYFDDQENDDQDDVFTLTFSDGTYLQVSYAVDDGEVFIPNHSMASLDVECPEEDE